MILLFGQLDFIVRRSTESFKETKRRDPPRITLEKLKTILNQSKTFAIQLNTIHREQVNCAQGETACNGSIKREKTGLHRFFSELNRTGRTATRERYCARRIFIGKKPRIGGGEVSGRRVNYDTLVHGERAEFLGQC